MDPNCMQVAKLLFAYVDGELSANDQRFVERHLEACAPCLDEAAKERLVKKFVSEESFAMPGDLKDRVLKALESASDGNIVSMPKAGSKSAFSDSTSSYQTGGWLAMAASLVLLVVSFYFIQHQPAPIPGSEPHLPIVHSAALETVSGECICVKCYLLPEYCPEGEHIPALMQEDGTLWTLLPNEASAELYDHFMEFFGKPMEVKGKLFDRARHIEVANFRLL